MGREIRRVPPNWEHPKKKAYNLFKQREEESYQPLYDRPYIEAITKWINEHELWVKGKHPDQKDGSGKDYEYYAQWGGNPPDIEYYRPNWKPEEMTWYQIYETVSEGTPVSPPFATKAELVEYLVKNGDFWDQRRGHGGWERKNAEQFVEREFAISMMVNTGTGEIKMARDGA